MLRLDPEPEGGVLVQIGRVPDPLQKLESEIASQRLLDHVAVAATGARCLHTNRAEHALVESDRRPRLRHIRIIASRCRRVTTLMDVVTHPMADSDRWAEEHTFVISETYPERLLMFRAAKRATPS